MLALFLASAFLGSGIVFRHRRALTYVAFAGVLFELQLLLASYIHRTIAISWDDSSFFFLAGIVCMTIWLSMYKQWKSPYHAPGSGVRDGFVAIALGCILMLAHPILQSNGYVGDEFIMRGFYNGDVATFLSLVQKSFDTPGLVAQNPFSGNGHLEYPTLLHGAVADLFGMMHIGKDWLRFLNLMVYAQIVITVPLLFLLWDIIWPEPANNAEKWFGISSRNRVYLLQTGLSLFAFGLSIDSFVYPQSHFFLMGPFFAIVCLLARASTLSVFMGSIGAVLLLFSNTVTGTAAAGCVGALSVLYMFDKKRKPHERGVFLGVALLLVLLMKSASSGRTGLANPHFSVSAAGDMARVALTGVFSLSAALYSLSRKPFIAIASILISFFAFLVFFLSDRNIVTENASRFLYHGFLIGHVLLLPLGIQLIAWLKRELLFTSRPLSELTAGWAAVATLCMIFFLPLGISAGSTYRSLLVEEENVISRKDQLLLWAIDANADPEDVIITDGKEPYAVPVFTGRAVLRTHDYWLSQEDDVSRALFRAYEGDRESQKMILPLGAYIIIPSESASLWNTASLEKIFDTGEHALYKTS